MTDTGRYRGVIVTDDPELGFAVKVMLGRCGFEVGAEVDDIRRAAPAAGLLRPEAVVLDVAVVGRAGLRGAIPPLSAAAPRSSVIVLAAPAFSGLREVAVASGALDLVETSDLRPLERTLRRLGDIPAGCSCWMSAASSGQSVVAEHQAHSGGPAHQRRARHGRRLWSRLRRPGKRPE